MKFYKVAAILYSILLVSCFSDITFDQNKISQIITNIEHAVNNDSLVVYQEHATTLTFFNFNSVLCAIAKQESNDDVFSIKPISFDAKGKFIYVEAFLNYTIDVKIDVANFNVNIPPKVMQKIISLGLPNKATFKFAYINEKYVMVDIKYPLRFKYMDLLQKYL